MNKNNNGNISLKYVWFCIAFLAVLFILSIIFALADIDCQKLIFDSNKLLTVIGIIVSTAGLFISVLLVVVAIDAYSNINKINTLKNDIDQIEKRTSDISESTKKTSLVYSELLFLLFDSIKDVYLINATNENRKEIKSKRYHLQQSLDRMCYQFPILDKETRLKLLRELGDLGEAKDIPYIEELLNERDKEISDLAKIVLDKLKNKYKGKSK